MRKSAKVLYFFRKEEKRKNIIFQPLKRISQHNKIMEEEGSSAATAVNTAASAPAIRFEIKKWNAVAMWSWDICADTCAICRNSLNEPSIEYQVCSTTCSFHHIYSYTFLFCRQIHLLTMKTVCQWLSETVDTFSI
jgi:hypothetical protein